MKDDSELNVYPEMGRVLADGFSLGLGPGLGLGLGPVLGLGERLPYPEMGLVLADGDAVVLLLALLLRLADADPLAAGRDARARLHSEASPAPDALLHKRIPPVRELLPEAHLQSGSDQNSLASSFLHQRVLASRGLGEAVNIERR